MDSKINLVTPESKSTQPSCMGLGGVGPDLAFLHFFFPIKMRELLSQLSLSFRTSKSRQRNIGFAIMLFEFSMLSNSHLLRLIDSSLSLASKAAQSLTSSIFFKCWVW